MTCRYAARGFLIAIVFAAFTAARAQTLPFDIGAPTLTDVWIDPVHGNDSNDGSSPSGALQTLTEGWNRIPQGTILTRGFRLQLMPGVYNREAIPNFMESRYGTAESPIIIQSAAASQSARLTGDLNVFDSRHLYLLGLDITPEPAGDVFHCERCDYILIRDSNLDGGSRQAHDMCKVNQSQHVYIETSTLSGADDNTIDFVAVQYGHVLHNRISNAQDWCMYAKGGSAYLRIDGNEFFNCGTGGFTAGQGTGFQFMVPPWIHYEAYDIKVINNVIHDTEGAGLGVNGGYDILLAWNTLYRTGSRSHMVEVGYGNRSCDGNPGDPGREVCQANLTAGGWGTTVVDDGSNYVRIPSRNVMIYDNLLYNPAGNPSPQIFSIPGPFDGPSQLGSNVPRPAAVDTNLQIRGNVIFDAGISELGLDASSGCADPDSACSPAQILATNTIGLQPQLAAPDTGDFHPAMNSNLFTIRSREIPPFTWIDAPALPFAPMGDLSNLVIADRDSLVRDGAAAVGAYGRAHAASSPRKRSARH
jgi:hypothetical protein